MAEKQKKNEQLKRGLKRRHLQMIAIGGSIGTGLFLAMGGTIRDAGPGGAMVGYAIMGIVVYCMMTALGKWQRNIQCPVRSLLMQTVSWIKPGVLQTGGPTGLVRR